MLRRKVNLALILSLLSLSLSLSQLNEAGISAERVIRRGCYRGGCCPLPLALFPAVALMGKLCHSRGDVMGSDVSCDFVCLFLYSSFQVSYTGAYFSQFRPVWLVFSL